MLRDIFTKAVRDQRRTLFMWSAGVVAYIALLMSIYPSIRHSAGQLQGYIDSLPQAIRSAFLGASGDFSSPIGFINTELLSWLAPIMFVAFAVSAASRALAGEEEDGTLSLVLSYPVSRRRLVLEKAAAVIVGVLVVGAVFWASLAVATAVVGTPVGAGKLFQAVALFTLLGLCCGMVTLAVGGATGRRTAGTAAGAGVAVAMYLVSTLAQIESSLHFTRYASWFYYSGGTTPLGKPVSGAGVAVLVGSVIVLLLVTLAAFERRDIRV